MSIKFVLRLSAVSSSGRPARCPGDVLRASLGRLVGYRISRHFFNGRHSPYYFRIFLRIYLSFMETNTGILWDVIWYIALDYMCIYNVLLPIVCIACTTDGRQGENIGVGGEGGGGGGGWDPRGKVESCLTTSPFLELVLTLISREMIRRETSVVRS